MIASADGGNPHFGTWKLNEGKSQLKPGGPKNNTVTYRDASNGMIALEVDGVDKDGKAVHWSWEGKFDGQPYKVTGSPFLDTLACTMKDAYSNTNISIKDGKQVAKSEIKVSADGKSRTITTERADLTGQSVTETAFYDKS